MDLITRSDDERLTHLVEFSDWIVLENSLLLALSRAESAEAASIEMSRKEGYQELETRIIELASELDAAEKERDEARGMVCRAREALDEFHILMGDRMRVINIQAALSSSSPCAHAERVKELEDALAWCEKYQATVKTFKIGDNRETTTWVVDVDGRRLLGRGGYERNFVDAITWVRKAGGRYP